MVDESQFGSKEEGKLDPMLPVPDVTVANAEIYVEKLPVSYRLARISREAREIYKDLAVVSPKKFAEIQSMLSGILDRVMQIEHELLK